MRGALLMALAGVVLLFSGCGRDTQEASRSTVTAQAKSDPDANPTIAPPQDQPTVADDGTLVLPEATRAAMAIKTSAVAQESFAGEQTLQFQIFREADEQPLPGLIYRKGFAYGMALLDNGGTGLKIGQETALASPSAPSKIFTGRIVEIDALPGSANRQNEVILELQDTENQFELSQSCTASFPVSPISNALVIAKSSVLSASSGTFAYVQTTNGYKRIPIRTGMTAADKVQVLEGLTMGDVVVTSPVQTLWLTELKLKSGGGND